MSSHYPWPYGGLDSALTYVGVIPPASLEVLLIYAGVRAVLLQHTTDAFIIGCH